MTEPSPFAPDVPAEFARRRRRQFAVTIPLMVVVLASAILATDAEAHENRVVAAVVFGITLVSLVAFSLVNWRCPSCRVYLHKVTNPKFCPNCGVAFH
jgi:hypothetical protein